MVVLWIALALWVWLRSSRRRHRERFGPPPAGMRWRTFAFFALWSCVWIAIGWWSAQVLAIVLALAFAGFAYAGLGPRGWSWQQQLRDGGIYSAAGVGTVALVAAYGFGGG